MHEAFIVNLNDDDSDEIVEFDLGSLIIPNFIGESQVTVETDRKATFIDLIRIGNSYKLTVDKANAKPGFYRKKITIEGSNGISTTE